MCSLHFENNLLTFEGVASLNIKENTIIEAFVRFRFASVAITSSVMHWRGALSPETSPRYPFKVTRGFLYIKPLLTIIYTALCVMLLMLAASFT